MTIFCNNCGHQTSVDNKFCPACGALSSNENTDRTPKGSTAQGFKLTFEAAKKNTKEQIEVAIWTFKWMLIPGIIFLLVYAFVIK